MPEKKVATTTTGILIGGKRSTGILRDACNADDTNDEANYDDQIGIADGKFGHSRMTILFYSVFLSLITAPG
jgi:hypothetical protein